MPDEAPPTDSPPDPTEELEEMLFMASAGRDWFSRWGVELGLLVLEWKLVWGGLIPVLAGGCGPCGCGTLCMGVSEYRGPVVTNWVAD